MSGKKPDLHVKIYYFCRAGFLPADFEIPKHELKTCHAALLKQDDYLE
jgi:hypothetical protein